jgi:integrase
MEERDYTTHLSLPARPVLSPYPPSLDWKRSAMNRNRRTFLCLSTLLPLLTAVPFARAELACAPIATPNVLPIDRSQQSGFSPPSSEPFLPWLDSHARAKLWLNQNQREMKRDIQTLCTLDDQDGIQNDSINNSLRLLRRMFTHARDTGNITLIARFKLLPGKSRDGFLPHELFQKLFDAMPSRFQPLLLLLYYTGVRMGEAEKIKWPALDLDGAKISLREGETKNDEPRILPLPDTLVKLLSAASERTGRVFPTRSSFRKPFREACNKARIGGLMIHDLRRSAVRNLPKAGIPEGVSMKISGHKDRTVFERYNIVDSQDILDAGKILQRALAPVKLTRALPGRKVR